jgi:hypothetical protein
MADPLLGRAIISLETDNENGSDDSANKYCSEFPRTTEDLMAHEANFEDSGFFFSAGNISKYSGSNFKNKVYEYSNTILKIRI